jgi:hypothetical protein
MQRKSLRLASITALLLSSGTALAVPFNSFDPRSMSMGGAGVAVGDPATAPFFNPALLSASDPAKKYSVEFPIIGARLYDPADMRNNLTTLSDNINALNSSISTANTTANSTSSTTLQNLPANMTAVANGIDKVNAQLSSLSNKPLQGEFGAATVIGVPGKNYGVAFYADSWGAAGGTLVYNDGTTLSGLSTSVRAAANALAATTGAAAAACQAVSNGTGTPADVQACLAAVAASQGSLVNAQGAINFNTNQLASKIHLRGVLINEAGLSISHGLVTRDQEWALGITPKYMQLQLFDALLDANSGNTNNATNSDNIAKYSTLNFDMGIAKSYLNGWRTGVVVKNVLPQKFDFKRAQVATGDTLNLNPQLRAGVSHETNWSTLAFDLDLTQNDPAGLENRSQYAALGGELSAFGWAQLRAGYRADMLNSARNVTSFGLGLSPRIPFFKLHFDLAYAYNADEQGASLRFGFNF